MLHTNVEAFFPDLTEEINLFPGADNFEITHFMCEKDGFFENTVTVNDKKYEYKDNAEYFGETERKRYSKRYAKLSVYRALSSFTGEKMAWGALTGIRPVKLAYQHGEGYEDFLRNEMLVSDNKTEVVKKIIEAQKGIYEINRDNGDFFVGIPFCPSRCSYCSFVSSEIAKAKNLPEYVDALVKEIASSKPMIKNLRSLYIGGGTPVSLPKELLKNVLDAVGKNESGVEYTVEAGRPDCIDRETLSLLKEYGVTRICVNPQTFNDKTLVLLGRKHTAADVIEKFALAREYGFDINCDLIAGLPEETLEDFKRSIDTVTALRPENVTVHTLCLKKGSKLKESCSRLDEGEVSEMIEYSSREAAKAGYSPYYLYRQKYMAANQENTGYALSGKVCVYNVDVMEEIADNVACGANAVSKKIFPEENRIERYGSPKDIATYISKIDAIIDEKKKLFGFQE
ncbi:MAG: coproporphyrinogen dehydrogenase HemZ [bacterium]|nr:coproporphyrinogen dehydrogenase HemZ [bacterium]